MAKDEGSRARRVAPKPFALPLMAAGLVAVALALLAEWRMQGLLASGNPANPLAWSGLRIGLSALLLFLGLAPLFVWIARGGIARVRGRLGADHGRLWRRLGIAIALAVLAGVVGWFLGWGAAAIQENPRDWRYSFTLMAFFVACALLVYFREDVLRDASWGFLILSLAVGLTFVALVPVQPNSVWDGQVHFDAANAMSYAENAEYDEGDLIALEDIPYVMVGHEGRRVWSGMSLDVTEETAETIDRSQQEGSVETLEGQMRHRGSSWVAFNSVGRVPLAVGLWLGRLLGLGDVGEYTSARIANLVVYVVLWFLGIRALKHSKLVLAAVALVPTGLYVASGFSYDAWLFACCGFSFCHFLGELQRPDEPLTGKGAATILISFALGCLVKAIYFPLALVFLAMPKRKFQPEGAMGRVWWAFWVVATALFLLSTFALPFLMRGGAGYSDTRMNEGASSTGQLAHIFEAPGEYLGALGASGIEFFGPAYFRDAIALLDFIQISSFESALGWVYLAFLLIVALFVRRPRNGSGSLALARAFAIVGTVGSYVLLATALYVGFTSVGDSLVDGLQPRYLLPSFPLIFGLVLFVPALVRQTSRWYRLLACASWAFLLAYNLALITLRFVVFFE